MLLGLSVDALLKNKAWVEIGALNLLFIAKNCGSTPSCQ